MNHLRPLLSIVLTCSLGLLARQAEGAFLTDYNLIVLGDLDSTSEVEGKAYIGGNLTGSSNYAVMLGGAVAPTEVTLQVGGDVSGSIGVQAGSVKIAGDLTSGSNLNLNDGNNGATYAIGGSINTNVNLGTQVAFDAITDLAAVTSMYEGLSATYAGLATNSSLSINAGQATLEADGSLGPNDLAVFEVDASVIFGNTISSLTVDLGTAGGAIVNVYGVSVSIPSSINGVGPLATDDVRSRLVWNFYEAEDISFGNQFNGGVLAPYADVTNANILAGTVVVDNFEQRGEVHLPLTVIIPEPAALLMLLAGCTAAITRR